LEEKGNKFANFGREKNKESFWIKKSWTKSDDFVAKKYKNENLKIYARF
jgi:hypothetical protein